jgi:hypothetical protein
MRIRIRYTVPNCFLCSDEPREEEEEEGEGEGGEGEEEEGEGGSEELDMELESDKQLGTSSSSSSGCGDSVKVPYRTETHREILQCFLSLLSDSYPEISVAAPDPDAEIHMFLGLPDP